MTRFIQKPCTKTIHTDDTDNNTDRTDRAKRDPYNGRVTAKHQYTCTKGTQVDYFLPRDAAEKIWSFWNRHQSPKSPFPSKCLVPGFLAH